MEIAITGAAGQLGRELARAEWPDGIKPSFFSHGDVDITDAASVDQALASKEVVINAAAYTAVDKAEAEPEAAFRVNRDGAATLAHACRKTGALLVHVSTDYVFDGLKSLPYVEDDPTAPLGVYGQSKAEGEAIVRDVHQNHLIVRTSWVVSAFGRNFVKTILAMARERDRLRIVADQFGRPTPAKDLATVLVLMTQRYASGAPIARGTYHFAAAGRASWHDLAREVVDLQASRTGRRPMVEPITTNDYATPARRPANSVLDTTKLETALGLAAEPWQRGVADIVTELSGDESFA